MNLEQAKGNIVTVFRELKAYLEKAAYEIEEDLQIPEESIRVNFSGYSIPESYWTEGILERISDLDKQIDVFEIFEDNLKERENLFKWMLFELSVEPSMTTFIGNMVPYKMSEEELTFVAGKKAEFESLRKEGWKQVVDFLNNKLAFEVPVSKSRKQKAKFIWNGSQQQLVELFRMLENKRWVKLNNTPTTHARAILETFDISNTKKTETSKEEESFIKAFIGVSEKGVGQIFPGHPHYEKLNEYQPSFKHILDNDK